MKAILLLASIILGSFFSVWASEKLNGTKAGEMLLSGYMSVTLTLGFMEAMKWFRMRSRSC